MFGIAYEAMLFAYKVHEHQRRRYTNNKYTDHLAEVAAIAASVAPFELIDTIVSTSWLHDCMEDQCVTIEQLQSMFGTVIADAVFLLSDLEKGSRAERKAIIRNKLSKAPGWIQTIKCADALSNISSIIEYDSSFAPVYIKEVILLIDQLTLADKRLLNLIRNKII